ncbi:hypothetical protein JHK82_031519 [Glycine max]|nr:hypothetical protein JHK85_032171 [Glycine max]KAG5124782.1 hypothetical protein JHK82_031519 [Glycine max]KAG5146200.1 hypothetical protein JHK84_031743 [Glycine max]
MAEQQIFSDFASSSNSSRKYGVFLSFRCEDTRKNFTSHLYEALMQKKIETYMDYQLEKGDEISPAIIQECKKKQAQIVIPAFYNIDPSHVRKQNGSYEQAFSKHEEEPRCNKWKAALTEVTNLAGWDSRNRTESELLKDIVGDVLRKLTPRYPSQLKGLVGIEKLMSLPELPSSLKEMRAFNCTSLETDFTQRLVLQHMLQSHLHNLPDGEDYDSGHEPDQESIRGCGVFPVYPSELGLKLFGSSSKEIFELEIITQISDNESQSRAIGNGVGGSNTEN